MGRKAAFILLIFLPLMAMAQKKQAKKRSTLKQNYTELGLNLSGAIGTFVQNRTDSTYNDPYAILVRYVRNRLGFRMAAGYSFNTVKEVNAIQARVNGLQRIDWRVGMDYRNDISDHWRLYYGADFLLGSVHGNKQFSEGDNVYKISIKEKMLGFGPLLGIQYRITPKISLQTEAAFYLMGINTLKKYYDDAKPDIIYTDNSKRIRALPGIPQSIALIVRLK
jgi:hypothetical protein